MDKIEILMSSFPKLHYVFDSRMPAKQKGLYVDNFVYLNPQQTREELVGTIAEEIGHYLTTVGDITDQHSLDNRKQEQKARDVGNMLAVEPLDLVECYESGCSTVWECAYHLQLSPETLQAALAAYRKKYSRLEVNEVYSLYFNDSGTVDIYKRV